MQDLKTGLFLADNDQTRRVLPQTSADIVEILSSAGEASNVQAEISNLRTAKLATPAVGGSAGQVLSLDESGNTVWKVDEKGDTLPSISSATAGQVLKVNSTVNGTEWGDVPKELPEQLGTSGQVLAVNSTANGVEWKTPESGLPAIGTASAGDLLAVNSAADGVEFVKPAFYTKEFELDLTSLNNHWGPASEIQLGSGMSSGSISSKAYLYWGVLSFPNFPNDLATLCAAGKVIAVLGSSNQTQGISFVVSGSFNGPYKIIDSGTSLGILHLCVQSNDKTSLDAHTADDKLKIIVLCKN